MSNSMQYFLSLPVPSITLANGTLYAPWKHRLSYVTSSTRESLDVALLSVRNSDNQLPASNLAPPHSVEARVHIFQPLFDVYYLRW